MSFRSRFLALAVVLVAGACSASTVDVDNAAAPAASATPAPTEDEPALAPVQVGVPGEWVRLPDGPLSARADAMVVWIDEQIVVYGGIEAYCDDGGMDCARPSAALSDGASFDTTTGVWRSLPDAPIGLWSPTTEFVAGRLFVMTGCLSDDACDTGEVLFELDPSTGEWTDLPIPADLNGFRLASVGDRLLATRSNSDGTGARDFAADVTAEPLVWEELPTAPLPDGFPRLLVDLDGELGAFTTGSDQLVHAASYDFDSGSWRGLAELGRSGFSKWFMDGRVYVTLELDDTAVAAVYESSSDAWSTLTDPPPGFDTSFVMTGVLGASDITYPIAVAGGWFLDSATQDWVSVPAPPTRVTGRVANSGRDLVMHGGTVIFDALGGSIEVSDETWLWTWPW